MASEETKPQEEGPRSEQKKRDSRLAGTIADIQRQDFVGIKIYVQAHEVMIHTLLSICDNQVKAIEALQKKINELSVQVDKISTILSEETKPEFANRMRLAQTSKQMVLEHLHKKVDEMNAQGFKVVVIGDTLHTNDEQK